MRNFLMGRFKPALWVTAFVCIFLSLLCAVVEPFELPESPHQLAKELGMWVTVDFATGLEVSRSHNAPDANLSETALLENALVAWLKDLLVVSVVLLKDVLTVSMMLLTASLVFALKLIGLALGLAVMAIFLRRVVWPMVFAMAVGMLDGILEWVASARDVVVVALDNYLARVKQDLKAAKGNLTLKLVRAVKDFPALTDALDKILEWVLPIKNADFERLTNFLDTLPKDLDIHFTPISQDHKKSVQLEAGAEEAECEDGGVWAEDFAPGIQLGLGVVEGLPLEAVREVIETEAVESGVIETEAVELGMVWPEVVKLELVQDLFRNRPYCRQTIFTANSSKDIEGLPLFIYPRKGRWFYLEMARRRLARAEAPCLRVRFIRLFRVSRMTCRHVSLKPRSRCRTKKKTSFASQVRLLQSHFAVPDGQNPNKIQGICPEQRIIRDNELGFGAEQFRIQGISSGTTGDLVEGKPEQRDANEAPGQAMGQSILEVREETEVFHFCDGNLVDVPAVVEEVQAYIEPIIVEGREEVRPQVFPERDEVIQQPDPRAMALTTEPAPDVKINELWANLRAVGLVIEPLGDVSSVGADVADSWNAEGEARASFEPAISEDAEAAIKPIIAEGSGEPHPQVLSQQEEAVQQSDLLATTLAQGPAPEANLQALDLVTEQSGAAPEVDVKVTDPPGMPATVEEAQGSLKQATKGEAEADIKPMVAKGQGEPHSQVLSQQEEAIQQLDPLAITLSQKPAPEANLDEPSENPQTAGLATEQLGIASEVGARVTDPSGMSATVETQVSLEQTTKGLFGKNGTVPLGDRFCCENGLPSLLKQEEKDDLYGGAERNRCIQTGPKGEAEVATQPMVAEGLGERHSQVSLYQEVIQQTDPQTMAPACEPAPMVNINDLWANLLTAGLVTEPLGCAPGVDANIADTWDVPLTMEEAGASLAPITTEWPREHHPQAFFQQEGVIQQTGPQSFPFAYEELPEANLDELWANLQAAGLIAGESGNVLGAEAAGLDSTYSQARASPPYDNPVADLTRHQMPGSGDGRSAPVGFTFRAQEPAPMNSPVEFGGPAVPTFLFGGEYATVQENYPPLPPPPCVNPFDFTQLGQQTWGPVATPSTGGGLFAFGNPPQFPPAALTPTEGSVRNCVVPGPNFVGFLGDNGGETSLTRHEEEPVDPGTDEEDKIYWADDMPEELRTSQGYYLNAPKTQTPMACPSFLFGSDSDITDFSDSELYELFLKEKDILIEGGPKEDKQYSSKKEDEENSDKKKEEEEGSGEADKTTLAATTPIYTPAPVYYRDGFRSGGAGNVKSGEDEIKWADNMPAHFSSPSYGRVSIPDKEKKKEPAATTSTYPPTPVYYRDGFRSGGAGNVKSGEDEIKWADNMPVHFSSPSYGRVSVPGKVEKDTKETREECGYNEAELAAASILLQLADPKFFGNGLPKKEEVGGGEEPAELLELLEREMSKGEHEDEDEDEDEDGDEDKDEDEDEYGDGDKNGEEDEDEEGIEWGSFMPESSTLPSMSWGPPLRKPACVGGEAEGAPDLGQFDLDTGDIEEEECQREKEKEKKHERKIAAIRRTRDRK